MKLEMSYISVYEVNVANWLGLNKPRAFDQILFMQTTVELQWLEHFLNHENMFETGVVRANECYR